MPTVHARCPHPNAERRKRPTRSFGSRAYPTAFRSSPLSRYSLSSTTTIYKALWLSTSDIGWCPRSSAIGQWSAVRKQCIGYHSLPSQETRQALLQAACRTVPYGGVADLASAVPRSSRPWEYMGCDGGICLAGRGVNAQGARRRRAGR